MSENQMQLELINKSKNEIEGLRISSQKFTGYLSKPQDKVNIKKNPMANNAEYIPISVIENELDELFFGVWSIDNFKWEVVANEIIGSIDLHVFHPILHCWIKRTGAGAAVIRQSKDAKITDAGAKLKKTLHMDFPNLKAECIKNAAKSLGKRFGRDLNRKHVDTYTPIIKPVSKLDEEFNKMKEENNENN